MIAALLSLDKIRGLARPSNFRYGTAIHRRGGVSFISYETDTIEAWVGGLKGSMVEGGSQRRRTRLSLSSKGLSWHCTGNPRNHQVFCKHCVALALAIMERESNRR